MSEVLGIDHVVIVAENLDETCAFYDRVFGLRVHGDHRRDGRSVVRQVLIGGAMLSVHQAGSAVEPAARHPAIGGADICLRWGGDLEGAVDLLAAKKVAIVSGPAARVTADGVAAQSIYFRDPDQNLIELICASSDAR